MRARRTILLQTGTSILCNRNLYRKSQGSIMKKQILIALLLGIMPFSAMAAYQYETKGNQGWLTFDSETTVAFDLVRSGKDKDQNNFIDRGEGIVDFGWYNLDTGATGSFDKGLSTTFTENDRIGLYVTDNQGNTFLSTKPRSPFEDDLWGKVRIIDGNLHLAGGNFGSNGTHEYYVFKVNNANTSGKTPSGQPLPGIIATLLVGGGTLIYLKKRKKLLASK